jgi:hypothetical protein
MQYSDYSEHTPTRQELRRLAAEGQLSGAAKDFLSPVKSAEELYDIESDPYQVHNLANDPEYQDVLARLRRDLHTWMIRTKDTGLLPEIEIHARSEGGSPYDMARHTDRFDPAAVLGAAMLVGRGTTACGYMSHLLTRPDAAVRYWGATGLAAMGAEALPARSALILALRDESASVRFAVAEALCQLGDDTPAVPVLAAGLKDDDPVVRLYAAATLVAIGPAARAAESQLRAALQEQPSRDAYSQYTRWALNRVLLQLE